MTRWSFEEKEWCCEHRGRGCEEPYDCYDGEVRAWTHSQIQWCCDHRRLGCMALIGRSEEAVALQSGLAALALRDAGMRRRCLVAAASAVSCFGAIAYLVVAGWRCRSPDGGLQASAPLRGEYSPVPLSPRSSMEMSGFQSV